MGGASSKHYNFKDFHERFVFGQTAVHNVVRRSLEIVLKETDLDQNGKENAKDERKFNDLKRYIDLFRLFIETHHTQEDRYIFPKASEVSKKENLFEEESDEHEKLSKLLATIGELATYTPPTSSAPSTSKDQEKKTEKIAEEKVDTNTEKQTKSENNEEDADAGAGDKAEDADAGDNEEDAGDGQSESPKDADAAFVEAVKSPEEIIDGIHAAAVEVGEMMGAHLAREEKILTADFWRDNSTEDVVRKLNTDIHMMTRRGEIMPKKAGLPWLQYHLTDNEQVFFDELLPFIVKKMIFPMYAKSETAGVWEFSFNPNIVNGKAVWPSPTWESGEPDAPSDDKEAKVEASDEDATATNEQASAADEESPVKDKETASEENVTPAAAGESAEEGASPVAAE